VKWQWNVNKEKDETGMDGKRSSFDEK